MLFDGLTSRLYTAEERISDIVDVPIKLSKLKVTGKKAKTKKEQHI